MDNRLGILITEIKKRRLALGMTQKEVAERCRIKQSNYSRFESGKQAPSTDTLLRMLDVLMLDLRLFPNDYTIYNIMYMDELVAVVKLSKDKKDITITKVKEDGITQPFSGNKLDLDRFYRFLKGRCYEDGRADLSEILKQAHMKDNNPYDFVRLSHGVTYDDFFWIKFEGEDLQWKDVRVR